MPTCWKSFRVRPSGRKLSKFTAVAVMGVILLDHTGDAASLCGISRSLVQLLLDGVKLSLLAAQPLVMPTLQGCPCHDGSHPYDLSLLSEARRMPGSSATARAAVHVPQGPAH